MDFSQPAENEGALQIVTDQFTNQFSNPAMLFLLTDAAYYLSLLSEVDPGGRGPSQRLAGSRPNPEKGRFYFRAFQKLDYSRPIRSWGLAFDAK